MLRQRVNHPLPKRLIAASWVVVGMLVLSACYRDAGENVQPTSNRVNLQDIAPTATATMTVVPPTETPAATVTVAEPQPTPTRKLVPTTTPSDAIQQELPTAVATEVPQDEQPTATPQLQPSFTPLAPATTPAPTATDSGIATPGMSDIQPSNTPAPTTNPALLPTPTGIPIEENPCIHVVMSGDTLYSIARDNEVEVEALIVANPSLLGGNPNTVLQIGWELQLPGCATEETPTPTPVSEVEEPEVTVAPGSEQQTGPVTHVVQAGEGIYSIARQYGVTPQAIIDANNLANPNLIYPGQTLIIPVGQ